ncbi:hypothetical protein V6Z12_D13G128700 [Gossypium hirsutum]
MVLRVHGVIYMSNDNDNDMIIMQIYSESERNFEKIVEKSEKSKGNDKVRK